MQNTDYESPAEAMAEQGFYIFSQFFNAEELAGLKSEVLDLIDQNYNQENLSSHSVYPSDTSEARVSNAFMIAEQPSPFPYVPHSSGGMVDRYLKAHNAVIESFTKTPVDPKTRCMINFQQYESGSKPVAEHFDGEYLRTQRSGNGIDFKLLEGLLPRYVGLLVVSNDNDGKGLELVEGDQIIETTLHAGDLIYFDNVRWRHRVPRLEFGRASIGMRNFDHLPWHFADSENEFIGEGYQRTLEGWVSDQVDCHGRLQTFFEKEWPIMKDEYSSYF